MHNFMSEMCASDAFWEVRLISFLNESFTILRYREETRIWSAKRKFLDMTVDMITFGQIDNSECWQKQAILSVDDLSRDDIWNQNLKPKRLIKNGEAISRFRHPNRFHPLKSAKWTAHTSSNFNVFSKFIVIHLQQIFTFQTM